MGVRTTGRAASRAWRRRWPGPPAAGSSRRASRGRSGGARPLRLEQPSGEQPEFVLGFSKRFFAGVQILIRPLPGQCVGEDLADRPEAPDQLVRPGPELTKRTEAEPAQDDAPDFERDRQVGFHSRLDYIGALVDSLRRHVFGQAIKAQQLSAADLLRIPGKVVFEDQRGKRRIPRNDEGVRGHDGPCCRRRVDQSFPARRVKG